MTLDEVLMPRTSTDARDRILATADEMFYRYGIRAVGIDTIIANSNVAKTTLYRHFPSKDDLVVAYLEGRNQRYWEYLTSVLKQTTDDPRTQLLTMFTAIDDVLSASDCQGCPFLITMTEFPDPDHPAHKVAIVNKQATQQYFTEHARRAGIENAEELGASLLMLLDGAFAQRRLFGRHDNGITFEKAAQRMLKAYEG